MLARNNKAENSIEICYVWHTVEQCLASLLLCTYLVRMPGVS